MDNLDPNYKNPNESKPIYNPTADDFTVTRADDNNVIHEYVIHAKEIESYPTYVADHIMKHLAAKIAQENPSPNYDDAYAEAVKLITVEL